jgi:hypothetical protein
MPGGAAPVEVGEDVVDVVVVVGVVVVVEVVVS